MTTPHSINVAGESDAGDEPPPLRAPISAMAELAFRLSLMELLAPAAWMLTCMTHGWKPLTAISLMGYAISLGIPAILTFLVSQTAIKQINSSDLPMMGKHRVHMAVAVGALSPVIWVLANWLLGYVVR